MEDEKSDKRLRVSAVGNSWIVTKSKSHPGHVYYFNTLTGEAVWNLSEAEMAKIGVKVQSLDYQTDAHALRPEPKDNPPTYFKKPFNKKSSFPQIQQLDMLQQHPEINILHPTGESASVYSEITMNNMPTFDLKNINNPINAINVISSPMMYNTNGWPISRSNQFFITPTIPILEQAQSTPSIAYEQLVRNNHSILEYNRFQNMSSRRNQPYQFNNKFGRGGRRNFNKYQMNQNDLRQQLYVKKKMSNIVNEATECSNIEDENGETAYRFQRTNTRTADVSSYIADTIEEEFKIHEKDHSEDDTNTNSKIEETPPCLDLTPLKNLAPNVKPKTWYIVVDLNVLLEEFNFLTTMTTSDEHCQLILPGSVMSELKDYIACSNNIPARRIFYSLSELINSGRASIAEKPSKNFGDTIANPILKTCIDLFEQDYHVILLTNDNKLLSYKKFIKINILTTVEVRELVGFNDHQPQANPQLRIIKSPLKAFSIKMPQKIPVNNSIITDPILNKDVCEENCKPKDTAAPPKCTADAAIQTEIVTVIDHKDNTEIDNYRHVGESSNNTHVQERTDTSTTATSNSSKRREIKLRRSVSNPPLQDTIVTKNTEKKPFRWRRKRNQNQALESNINTNDCDSKIASIQTDSSLLNFESEKQVAVPNTRHVIVHDFSSSVGSRESSIICTNTCEHQVTIEETSTSGIISNTDSNLDAENYYNSFDKHNGTFEESSKIFEVDSEHMAESLKTKCEEWVSRFIQIMEEALSVVLQKEPAFSNIEFPPPWTLHEAAQCIRKYSNDATVRNVTNKLSIVLFRLSDDKGTITRNMEPCQYMEMYSYGVSLLAAVKHIVSSCEDLEIAEESLHKLLLDIKNPNYGMNDLTDAQGDLQNIQVARIEIAKSNAEVPDNELSPPKEKLLRLDNKTQVNYELRSRTRLMKEVQKSPVKIIRNFDVKTTFLSNFNLQEVTANSSVTETNESCGTQDTIIERTQVAPLNGDTQNEVVKTTDVIATPSIVRNFTKCAEFEERLKNKFNSSIYDDEEYLEYEDYEYTSADEFDESIEVSDPNITQILETSDIDISQNLVASSPILVEPTVPGDSNNTFKFIICMFLEEVKKAINEVKILCDKSYTELKDPQLPTVERNELRNTVESAHKHIVGLSTSLESMLDQNPEASTDNMLMALKRLGINFSQIDKNLISEYGKTIASWKKHADEFLYAIQDIITAFKTH